MRAWKSQMRSCLRCCAHERRNDESTKPRLAFAFRALRENYFSRASPAGSPLSATRDTRRRCVRPPRCIRVRVHERLGRIGARSRTTHVGRVLGGVEVDASCSDAGFPRATPMLRFARRSIARCGRSARVTSPGCATTGASQHVIRATPSRTARSLVSRTARPRATRDARVFHRAAPQASQGFSRSARPG